MRACVCVSVPCSDFDSTCGEWISRHLLPCGAVTISARRNTATLRMLFFASRQPLRPQRSPLYQSGRTTVADMPASYSCVCGPGAACLPAAVCQQPLLAVGPPNLAWFWWPDHNKSTQGVIIVLVCQPVLVSSLLAYTLFTYLHNPVHVSLCYVLPLLLVADASTV